VTPAKSWRGFSKNRGLQIFLDRIARRYGKLPTEVIDPDGTLSPLVAYSINKTCALVGAKQDLSEAKRRNK
jgi:hypothetical protein